MNDADIDLINKTFYPGWLLVSQLRSGQEVKDGEALYRRACRWVNAARESLNEAGFSTTSCDHMLYAYCALMDESVLNRDKQDDGYRQWRKDPLQARFFRTLNAGEELWERIRTALREPAPDVAVLTCLYRTLQLGFTGQYRTQDDERREDVVRALSERVPPFALTQESGGPDAVVPQNVSDTGHAATSHVSVPSLTGIASGQELLSQARILADYLRNQPDGWLSAHRLIKNLRHDTLRQLPPLLADGKTRIEPPKPDQRALLKRLYLQQSWRELMEEADSLLSRGANHLWLDVQWYLHQALLKSGREHEAAIIQADLKGLLSRLTGLETLAFNDGTPFADEVTLNWIQQQVMDSGGGWQEDSAVTAATASGDNDILQLESEALTLADSDGPDVALSWLQNRPSIITVRSCWLLRLLMARVAEQTGKNELALHLLGELDGCAAAITLTQWERSGAGCRAATCTPT
ncbi:hypothetical protein ENINMM108B2_18325 [Enterobacter intestinihominis]